MLVYHAFKHVLKKDNKTVLVNEREWGEAQLTEQELEEFRKDFEIVNCHEQNLILNGSWIIEMILEQHPLGNFDDTNSTGVKVIFPNESADSEKPTFHPVYYKWLPMMLADTNLIYVSPIWVSE